MKRENVVWSRNGHRHNGIYQNVSDFRHYIIERGENSVRHDVISTCNHHGEIFQDVVEKRAISLHVASAISRESFVATCVNILVDNVRLI